MTKEKLITTAQHIKHETGLDIVVKSESRNYVHWNAMYIKLAGSEIKIGDTRWQEKERDIRKRFNYIGKMIQSRKVKVEV